MCSQYDFYSYFCAFLYDYLPLLHVKEYLMGREQEWATLLACMLFIGTETCMVRTCHTSQQLLQNCPWRHLGGWVMLWSAEVMLDGQRKRVDIPAHTRTAHKGLLQKRLEEDRSRIVPHAPLPPPLQNDPTGQGTELNWCWSLCISQRY